MAKRQDFEKPFDKYLAALDRGRVNDEAGAQLRRVVEAVKRTGEKGHLTLRLTVESLEDGEHVSILSKITSNAPSAPMQSTLFLALEGGDVEPVQQVLDLGGDDKPRKEPRH